MHRSGVSRRVALTTGAAAVLGLAVARVHAAAAQGSPNLPLITKAIPSTGEQLPVIGLGTNACSVDTPERMAPLRDVLQRMGRGNGRFITTRSLSRVRMR